jgi:hypothetical protein
METITLCSPIAKELGEKGLHWREWGSLFVWRDIGNFLDVQRKPPEKKGFSRAILIGSKYLYAEHGK